MTGGRSPNNRTNNWYVITGGPCSGKSTTVNLLSEMGYRTTVELARHYLDTQRILGRSVQEIIENHKKFQAAVLRGQIQQERHLDPNELVFLDRAIPDARAYYRYLGLPEDDLLRNAIAHVSYRKIFILDPLPLVNDYARLENDTEQLKLHELLIGVYSELPFPLIRIAPMPARERVARILEHLSPDDPLPQVQHRKQGDRGR